MISSRYREYHELRINVRRARIQDIKGEGEADHRKDLVDQNSKSKVQKKLSTRLDFIVKLTSLLLDSRIA